MVEEAIPLRVFLRTIALGLLACCGLAASIPAHSRATSAALRLHIAVSPVLHPAFDPSVTDYVTRCVGGHGVSVTLAAPHGVEVSADGAMPRSGRLRVHEPVVAGQAFSFTTRMRGATRTYHVRCLPSAFPHWSFKRAQASPGHWTIASPSLTTNGVKPYAAIFDANGVPVWWYRVAPAPVDVEFLPDHTLAIARYGKGTFGTDPNATWDIRRLDGTLVRKVRAVGEATDDHDIQLTPGGDYALISYVPRAHVDLSPYGGPSDATVMDAELQLVSKAGKLLWSWNSKDHVSLAESQDWYPAIVKAPVQLPNGSTVYDIVHANAVQVVGSHVILSLRHADAVYEIDRASGAIVWKLGGTPTPQSLQIVGDPLQPHSLGGQHDARLQPDGTLTLHENGTDVGRPPRAVRFRIDPVAHTATFLEQVRDPSVKASPCCGSAVKLTGGDWLVSWGGNPLVGEYTPNGAVVWTLAFDHGLFSYRANPVPYSTLAREDLRAAMDRLHPRARR